MLKGGIYTVCLHTCSRCRDFEWERNCEWNSCQQKIWKHFQFANVENTKTARMVIPLDNHPSDRGAIAAGQNSQKSEDRKRKKGERDKCVLLETQENSGAGVSAMV